MPRTLDRPIRAAFALGISTCVARTTLAQAGSASIEWVGAPPYVPHSTYYPWELRIDAMSDNGQIVAAHVTETLSHVSIATTTYFWSASLGWSIAGRFPSAIVTALSRDASIAIVDELIDAGIAKELHRRWWVGSDFIEVPSSIRIRAMNPSGDVAVGYRTDPLYHTTAVRLVRTGLAFAVEELWAADAAHVGMVSAVSADGRAAVGWIGQFDGAKITTAYDVRWVEGVGVVDNGPSIGVFGVGIANGARAVVGGMPGPGLGAAGLWDLGRRAWPFYQPSNVFDSASVAIDANGMVAIGNSRTLVEGWATGSDPWVWDRVSRRRSLKDVLAPFGVTIGATSPPYLQSMTSDGRWVLAARSYIGFSDPNPSGFYRIHLPAFCYANCDGGHEAQPLNSNDFACFLRRYAAGDPYANCDGSTTPPMLNVSDFVCFLQRFRAGCPN